MLSGNVGNSTNNDEASYTRRTEKSVGSSDYTILPYAPHTKRVIVGYRDNQLTNLRRQREFLIVLSFSASRELPHILGYPKVQYVFKKFHQQSLS